MRASAMARAMSADLPEPDGPWTTSGRAGPRLRYSAIRPSGSCRPTNTLRRSSANSACARCSTASGSWLSRSSASISFAITRERRCHTASQRLCVSGRRASASGGAAFAGSWLTTPERSSAPFVHLTSYVHTLAEPSRSASDVLRRPCAFQASASQVVSCAVSTSSLARSAGNAALTSSRFSMLRRNANTCSRASGTSRAPLMISSSVADAR